jgi:hypothetical protein
MPVASTRDRLGRGTLLAIVSSLVLHAMTFVWLHGLAALPDVGLEIARPNEIEFGVYAPNEQTSQNAPISAPTTARPADQALPPPLTAARPKPPVRHSTNGSDAANKSVAPPATTASVSGSLTDFAPKGAQVALRLDLDALRDSSFAEDTRALLGAMPDVRALLDGSGVDPVRDLSRLFLASPDLRREHVVMAGRYHGDVALARDAVENLAKARGDEAAWRDLRGIQVAAWQSADSTARVLALVGPQLFTITREEDLGRVLAVARSLASKHKPTVEASSNPAQELIRMADHELMAVSAENARSFVHGAHLDQVPTRFELSVVEAGDDALELHVQAQYPSSREAEDAAEFWSSLRDRYARHPLLALMGMDAMLRDAKLSAHAEHVEASLRVPRTQARLLLKFARDALHQDRTPPDAQLPARREAAPSQAAAPR